MKSSVQVKTDASVHRDTGWYLVQANARAERLAKFQLELKRFEVYLPMRAVAKKTAQHAAPFFPRYLFVWIDGANPRWEAIRTTIGVQALVRNGAGLGRVPSALVETLRSREEFGLVRLDEGANASGQLRHGDLLRIESGALMGFEAVFDCTMSDARRVAVLLTIYGRVSKVVLPRTSVRKLDA